MNKSPLHTPQTTKEKTIFTPHVVDEPLPTIRGGRPVARVVSHTAEIDAHIHGFGPFWALFYPLTRKEKGGDTRDTRDNKRLRLQNKGFGVSRVVSRVSDLPGTGSPPIEMTENQ